MKAGTARSIEDAQDESIGAFFHELLCPGGVDISGYPYASL
jgi:hypothetical protein